MPSIMLAALVFCLTACSATKAAGGPADPAGSCTVPDDGGKACSCPGTLFCESYNWYMCMDSGTWEKTGSSCLTNAGQED